jgi:HEAT repeat protein
MMQHKFENNDLQRQIIDANKEASKPVLDELREAGFEVEWISELYNKQINYRTAIPILLKWLPKVENSAVKEAIVRALSVPWARKTEAQRLFLEEFRNAGSNFALKWAIGNALSVVADDDILPDIVELVKDTSHGKAREMVVVALGNMKAIEVDDFLMELLDDDALVGHAIMALGKLRSKKSRPEIEKLLSHEKSWVRNEAKKALAKIDKAST